MCDRGKTALRNSGKIDSLERKIKKRRYKHIIWDWNGTLFDDAWLCIDVMNGCLMRRNLPQLTAERHRKVFQFPVKNYYINLGFDFGKEPFEVSGTEFIREYEKRKFECRLREDAIEVLHEFHKGGIGQSILSACQQENLNSLVDYWELSIFFEKLIGLRNHYARGKMGNGLQWIKTWSHNPEEVVLVGDTVHDYEVSVAMGIDCILIDGGSATRARLVACEKPVLRHLKDLLNYIEVSKD